MKPEKSIILTIFGATGDLAHSKILPALLDLYLNNLLPKNFKIVGFSRKDLTDEDYREFAINAINDRNHNHSEERIKEWLEHIHYYRGDLNDIETYKSLSTNLHDLDAKQGLCSDKIFYLAVPPNLYDTVFNNLSKSGVSKPCSLHEGHWTRVLVEKPFGSDKKEAKRLDSTLGKLFDESQIFRIDHYLAKETIQNILSFRFANAIFEPLWNKDHIEKIEIVLHENNDLENRASFYDGIGALRDVGQNHLLQMLAAVTMDDPKGISAENIRKARYGVLSKIKPFSNKVEDFAFRGQYDGYQDHEGVAPKSKTETFFRLKLGINDRRWKGVPIYLESGKGLGESRAEIVITFSEKDSFVCPIDDVCAYNNVLKINIQPSEEISLLFWAKKPGLNFDLEQKNLSFTYGAEKEILNDAYEKVLYDCIRGDSTLFASTEEIATEWRIVTGIVNSWKNLPVEKYDKGIAAEDIKKTFN